MIGRVQGFLAQWGLLGAGVLAAGLLALHEYPESQKAAIYTVPQVLAGWHRQPDRWVGRTILVRAESYSACAPASLPTPVTTIPCVTSTDGVPWTMLYDNQTHEEIPTVRDTLPSTDPQPISSTKQAGLIAITPPVVLRVKFLRQDDCGPLGLGQHPCLMAEGVAAN